MFINPHVSTRKYLVYSVGKGLNQYSRILVNLGLHIQAIPDMSSEHIDSDNSKTNNEWIGGKVSIYEVISYEKKSLHID